MAMDREHDLILFGATGFVGKLCADYLAQHAPQGMRIALAGRDHSRLEQVRATLPASAHEWPLLVADSNDARNMRLLAATARVVATTVGPYLKYGTHLVEACAELGTDYLDLTGEIVFVRKSIDSNQETAQATGARIVHSCGFDSIPSDLGVLETATFANANNLGTLGPTTLLVTSVRGGFSGGTIDSLRTQIAAVQADPSLRKVVGDPYSLSPHRKEEPKGRIEEPVVSQSDELGGWTAPFVMASFNTRIVRRSNALQGWSYGRDFRYREVTACGPGPSGAVKAMGMAAVLGAVMTGMQNSTMRRALDRLFPSPGEGPSDDTMRNGRFRMRIHSTTSAGAKIVTKIGLDLDPGYMGTALMFVESALTLAEDRDKTLSAGGVHTPASAMGSALITRLRAAGMTLEAQTPKAE
jgi:short subunit dehydrogenase-like uncharacterized protein